MIRLRNFAVFLLLLLLLGACGESGNESGGSSGSIDVALMFTTQGIIAEKGWVVLEDDKGLQPAENIVPVIREDATSPEIEEVLNAVSANLTTAELTELNRRVDVEKEDPESVAQEWLDENGFTDAGGGASGGPITVGSTDFSEQLIVAEMYRGALEAAGVEAEASYNLGSREIVEPALEEGEIDLYPEYVGTALEFLNGGAGEATNDTEETTAKLREAFAEKDIKVLEPAEAQDKNAIVVTAETAEEHGLETISDLKDVAPELVFGGPPECPERPLCLQGLEDTYGLEFKEFRSLDAGGPLTIAALEGK